MIILLSLLLYYLVWIGYGRALARLLRISCQMSEALLFGPIALGTLAVVLNFLVPVSSAVSTVIAILGLLLFAITSEQTDRHFTSVLIALPLGLATFVPEHLFDSGAYGLPTMEWLMTERVAFGLVHLNINFAGNSLWFPTMAAHVPAGLGLAAAFSANTLLSLAFLLFLLENRRHKLTGAFALVLFVFFLFPEKLGGASKILYETFGSPGTDAPAAVYTLAALVLIVRALETRKLDLEILLLFALYSTFVKLSHATVFLSVGVVLWDFKYLKFKKHIRLLVFAGVLATAWVVRGAILSGCIAFPAAATCLNVPWTVLTKNLVEQNQWIKSWARSPGENPHVVLADWGWFWEWLVRTLKSAFFKNMLYMIIVGTVLSFIKRGTKLPKLSSRKYLLVSLALALIVWFFQAPDLRFAYGFWVGVSALIFSSALVRFFSFEFSQKWVVLMLVLFSLNARMVYPLQNLSEFLSWKFPRLPLVEVTTLKSQNDQNVFVPSNGTQCWDTKLPCLLIPTPNLIIETYAGYLFFRSSGAAP